MMVTGWNYFIHDSWHFPILQTYQTNPDDGLNILYTDSIPLVALIGKILGCHTSSWQPYGVWHLCLYILQSVFGALLGRRLGLRGMASLSVSLLALSTQAFILRFYHEGLNGQFVILWAYFLYLGAGEPPNWRRIAAGWAGCVTTAILLHPYLGVMTMGIAAAGFVRLARSAPRSVAPALAVALVVTLAVLVLCGYVGHRLPPPPPSGFGDLSTNLLSPFVPVYSTVLPWLPPAGLQDATGLQWDGASFFGLGVLGLLAACLLGAPRLFARTLIRHAAAGVVLVAFAVFAASNRVYFAHVELVHYEVPRALRFITDQLRASGRFFWPVTYGALIAAAGLAARAWRFGPIAVVIAALLQTVDANAVAQIARDNTIDPWKVHLDRARWEREIDGASRVNILPEYLCWRIPIQEDPTLFEERALEYIVAARGMRTNAGRTGRQVTDCSRSDRDSRAIFDGSLRPGELYVLFKPAFTSDVLAQRGAACIELDVAFACRRSGP
jgi:hypothetical protein